MAGTIELLYARPTRDGFEEPREGGTFVFGDLAELAAKAITERYGWRTIVRQPGFDDMVFEKRQVSRMEAVRV